MSFKFQSLLGDASIDADAVITSELDADTANISSLKVTTTSAGVISTNTFKIPTNAVLNNVLTCINLNGTAAWRPPVDVNLAGDAVGIAGGNRVDTLAGGTILVSNLVTLAGSQTLTNKTLDNFTVSGVETLQKNLWFNNQLNTKMINLWDSGTPSNQTQHNFYGFGISLGELRYHVAGTTASHVFYTGTSATTSTELFRIGGNGVVTIPGTLKITTGGALGKVLTSDASGNASWANIPPPGNLTGDITSVGLVTTASASIARIDGVQSLTNKTITGTSNTVDANTLRNGSTYAIPLGGSAPSVNTILTYDGTNASWLPPAIVSPGNLTGDITSIGLVTTASASMVKINGSQTLTNKTITGTTNTVDANTLRNGSTYAIALSGAAPTTNQVLSYNGTNAIWSTPTSVTSVTMAGDVTGNSATNVVTKATGNFSVNNTISSASASGLVLSSTGGLYGASKLTIQNITGCNGALLDTTGATVALVDLAYKTGALSMTQRFETRTASLANTANATYGESQVLVNGISAYFGSVSSGVTGYFNAPQGVWTGKITYPNVDVRKRLCLWEGGQWTDYNDHRFTGLGKISNAMLFSSVATTDDFVFSAATSATTSNELMRVKGNGAVSIPGNLGVNGAGDFALSIYSPNINCLSTTAQGYRAPTVQGTYVTWNREGGTGKACWGNQKGYGGGGHEWVDYDLGTNATTVLATLDNAGNFASNSASVTNLTAGSVTTNNIVFPLGTLSHYEEATYDSTWTGPATTGTLRLLITRIGRVVTASMVRSAFSLYTTTPGQLDWTMTSTIEGKFAPIAVVPPGMTFLVPIVNNGSTQPGILSVNINTNTIKLSTIGSAVWAGTIGWNPWSVSWTAMPYIPY